MIGLKMMPNNVAIYSTTQPHAAKIVNTIIMLGVFYHNYKSWFRKIALPVRIFATSTKLQI